MNINNIENILEFPKILPMVYRDFICITALILIVLLLLILHSVQEDSQAFGPCFIRWLIHTLPLRLRAYGCQNLVAFLENRACN